MADKKPYAGPVVIGAGLPRTGTNSMMVALEKLLDGKCYHMKTVFKSSGSEDTEFWGRLIRRNANDKEFDEFLAKRDVRSTVDYPTSFYWKRLIEMYPEAKVILTTRRPETWRKSVLESIYYVLNASKQFPVSWTKNWTGIGPRIQVPMDVCNAIPDGDYSHSVISSVAAGEEASVDFFNKWNAEVVASVPKDRLLVFQAKEGWGPLCKFLGVPVPEDGEPYPWVNDTAEFRGIAKKIRVVSFVMLLLPVLFALLLRALF